MSIKTKLEMEHQTLLAIQQAMANGDYDGQEYELALIGVCHRLKHLAEELEVA